MRRSGSSIFDEFAPMREVIPPGTVGCARVEHFSVSKKESEFTAMRARVTANRDAEVSAGDYVRLIVVSGNALANQCLGRVDWDGHGDVVMSDTRMEQETNIDFLLRARGRVLVAGLGIGLILIPALKSGLVRSIEVIEKHPDVIRLVEPYLRKYLNDRCNEKLTVTQADIFEWKPPKGKKWDVIYFDIWNEVCEDNLEEITRLKRKFARRLNREHSECWMSAWKEDDLRYWRNYERRRRAVWG